jgi:hypothetical protein
VILDTPVRRAIVTAVRRQRTEIVMRHSFFISSALCLGLAFSQGSARAQSDDTLSQPATGNILLCYEEVSIEQIIKANSEKSWDGSKKGWNGSMVEYAQLQKTLRSDQDPECQNVYSTFQAGRLVSPVFKNIELDDGKRHDVGVIAVFVRGERFYSIVKIVEDDNEGVQ